MTTVLPFRCASVATGHTIHTNEGININERQLRDSLKRDMVSERLAANPSLDGVAFYSAVNRWLDEIEREVDVQVVELIANGLLDDTPPAPKLVTARSRPQQGIIVNEFGVPDAPKCITAPRNQRF